MTLSGTTSRGGDPARAKSHLGTVADLKLIASGFNVLQRERVAGQLQNVTAMFVIQIAFLRVLSQIFFFKLREALFCFSR